MPKHFRHFMDTMEMTPGINEILVWL